MLLEGDACWVVFDAVGTLIYSDPPVHEVYHRIGRRHRSCLTLPEVRQRLADVFRERSQAQNHSTSETIEYEFWQMIVAEVLCDVTDRAACFEELYNWFAQPASWRCYDDVGPTVLALQRRGYRLAMASNFDDRLHAVCGGLEDLQSIDKRVISSEVGWRKPHFEFYRRLIDECGGDASRIVMIGDDPTNDVWGAQQAGLRAVLLDRGRTNESMKLGEPAIGSLCELIIT